MQTLPFEKNQSLIGFNSFGIDVKTDCWIRIQEPEQLLELFSQEGLPEKKLILGGGSNILFTQDFAGLIIKMDIQGITAQETGKNQVLVTAGAGVVWNDLVWYCVDNEYCGIENMALIPGTAGAAPVQNIGAYGRELMDVFESCTAYDHLTKHLVTMRREDCHFSYRDSIFKSTAKDRYIITSLTLKLSKTPDLITSYGTIQQELQSQGISDPSLTDIAKIVSKIRVEKLPDPATIGNAGSFFKNPVVPKEEALQLKARFPGMVMFQTDARHFKIAAGWMIEHLGWKGRRIDNCGTWKNQALVLVNHGQATGQEIFNFSEKILQDVYSKFGVLLEREVNII